MSIVSVGDLLAAGWWDCGSCPSPTLNAPTIDMCLSCFQPRRKPVESSEGASGAKTRAVVKPPNGGAGRRKGNRKLREHRKPNKTEAEFGLILEAKKQKGEIEYYGFEEITLRWADMEYTPDFFVIRRQEFVPRWYDEKNKHGMVWYDEKNKHGMATLIEAVYIELKGAHKWEDSIIKYKAARARFTWARFEMHEKRDGRWSQIA